MRLSLLVLLLVPSWGPAAASVPVFLKFMADQTDGYDLGLSNPGHWQPMARSVAPYKIVSGPHTLKMEFLVPNDEWSLQKDRAFLLVLNPRATSTEKLTITIKGQVNDGDKPWQLMLPVLANQDFIKFNLTEDVDPRNQEVLRLELSVSNDKGEMLAPGEAIVATGLEHGPLLVVTEIADGSVRPATRPRRTTFMSFSSLLPGCRLEHWAATAVQLGWQDIVYPRTLRLNLCVGQCPRPVLHRSLKPSSHALARSLFKTRNALEAANYPDVQCVPIRFRAMSMVLEPNPGNYTVVVTEDLAAMDCGCR